ncbi:oligosaccharide flippase family protein [Gammaproteobacteria bacterium]|nr:oligosaccharide flippase family protein [Gammaproteobacteria bacterium]
MTSLLSGSFYYSLSNLIPQSLAFLILPLYSKYMSVSDYGIISAMETLSIVLSAFICLSIDKAGHRLYFDQKNEDERKRFLSTLYITSILITSVIFAALVFARPFIQLLFENIAFYPFFIIAILNVGLNTFSLIPAIFYQVSEQPIKYMYLKISRFVLQILLIFYLVVFEKMGALGHLIAESICLLIFLPIYISICFKNFGFTFDYKYLKGVFNFAIPLIPTLLIAWILTLSDRVFIERILDLTELGSYSMSYRISMIYILFTGSFMLAYTPFFYKTASNPNIGETNAMLEKMTLYITCSFLFLYFIISLYIKELVDLMIDDSYSNIHGIIRILIAGHCISAIMSVSSGLSLLKSKRTNIIFFVSLIAAVSNIWLNFYVIELFGIRGAAYSSIIATSILFALQFYFARKGYFIELPLKLILTIFLCISFITIVFHFYLEAFYLLSVVFKLILCITLSYLIYKFYYPDIVDVFSNNEYGKS